jgi:DNA-binding transcriptional MerR regulator
MGQPNPPGENVPLYEGLDASWNDIVGAFPEDRRNELAPLLKSRIDQYEPLKQWEDLHKSGITPKYASDALNVFSIIENNPQQVYDTIGKYLGITPKEAKAAVEEFQATEEEDDGPDPRIQTMQEQIDTLAQIALSQRQQTVQQQQAAEADAAVEKDLSELKKKYGDVDEDQVLLYMLNGNGVTAEQAYQMYTERDNKIRSRRPAPMLMGSGGAVPAKQLDVRKMNPEDTRSLVAQMMQYGNQANKD